MTQGHPLRLFNSLDHRLEEFTPAGSTVGLYSCGPTVYAYAHLGNLRAYIFADTLRRTLRWKGFEVRHVTNITDVGHAVAETELGEDKVEVAAARERRSVEEIAEMYTKTFFDDLDALGILPADDYPRATAHIQEMLEFAAELEARGFTYQLPTGLYFDSSKVDGYGRLAQIDLAGQREGARVERIEGRRNKTDFALWRAERPGQVRAMRWDSPWGWGAPGWHLECSVMSMRLLGAHFDLHTGGVDHRELHHVNEIAQSEAFLGDGRPWVRYWLHNEFLRFGDAKISKSAGGAPRLADLTSAGIPPMAYRIFLLGAHYRTQVDFSHAAIESAGATLRRIVRRIDGGAGAEVPQIETLEHALASAADDAVALNYVHRVDAAASDDLNSPQVLAILQEVLRDASLTSNGRNVVVAACDSLLGLGLAKLTLAQLEGSRVELSPEQTAEIESLIGERELARKERQWARADEIRTTLDQLGVTVTDTPDGPTWTTR